MRTLKNGAKGEDVKRLQAALNAEINAGLTEDGIFGKLTLAAVKEYQKANGLSVDGIAGAKTLGSLGLIDNSPVEIQCEDLKQFSSPHGSMIYGPDKTYSTYASGGCGVTSFAIVQRAYGLVPAGETATQTIQRLGKYSWEHGYRPKGAGTNAGLFGTNGCKRKTITSSAIETNIRAGNLVILNIKKGFPNGYTGSGHYIVAYGIKDGKLLLRDVGSSKAARQSADIAKIASGLKYAWAITKSI